MKDEIVYIYIYIYKNESELGILHARFGHMYKLYLQLLQIFRRLNATKRNNSPYVCMHDFL